MGRLNPCPQAHCAGSLLWYADDRALRCTLCPYELVAQDAAEARRVLDELRDRRN